MSTHGALADKSTVSASEAKDIAPPRDKKGFSEILKHRINKVMKSGLFFLQTRAKARHEEAVHHLELATRDMREGNFSGAENYFSSFCQWLNEAEAENADDIVILRELLIPDLKTFFNALGQQKASSEQTIQFMKRLPPAFLFKALTTLFHYEERLRATLTKETTEPSDAKLSDAVSKKVVNTPITQTPATDSKSDHSAIKLSSFTTFNVVSRLNKARKHLKQRMEERQEHPIAHLELATRDVNEGRFKNAENSFALFCKWLNENEASNSGDIEILRDELLPDLIKFVDTLAKKKAPEAQIKQYMQLLSPVFLYKSLDTLFQYEQKQSAAIVQSSSSRDEKSNAATSVVASELETKSARVETKQDGNISQQRKPKEKSKGQIYQALRKQGMLHDKATQAELFRASRDPELPRAEFNSLVKRHGLS